MISFFAEENITDVCLLDDFNAKTNTVSDFITNEVRVNNIPELDMLTDDDTDIKNVLDTPCISITRKNSDVAPTYKAGKS